MDPLYGHSLWQRSPPGLSISIRHARLCDVHAHASVVLRSFDAVETGLFRKLVQSMTPEEQRRRDISMSYDKIKELKHQLLTDNILTTVASKDGNTVGCATWTVHLGTQAPTPLQRYVRQITYEEKLLHLYLLINQKVRSWLPKWPKWIEAWIWPVSQGRQRYERLGKVSMQNRQKARSKCFPGPDSEQDYLVLDRLAVLPEFTEQGIGRALVQQGIDAAKNAGVPIYLISSPSGKALYERVGFTTLDEYDIGDEAGVLRTETVMMYETL